MSGRPGQVSFSSIPSIGSPVSMIRRSSSAACCQCSLAKKSRSCLPSSWRASARPIHAAIRRLASTNRDSKSLKYTCSGTFSITSRSRWRSSSSWPSAFLRREMSIIEPAIRRAAPVRSRTTVPRIRSQRQLPAPVRTRQSIASSSGPPGASTPARAAANSSRSLSWSAAWGTRNRFGALAMPHSRNSRIRRE